MKKLILLLLVTFSCLVLALAFYALNTDQGVTSQHDPMVGKSIVHLAGTTLDNQEVILSSQLTDWSIVNVWASWCSICKQEHSFLLDLANRGEITIIGVNYRDEKAAALSTLQQTGNPYSVVLFDPNGKLAFELGVIGTPETFLVDSSGEIVMRFRGPLNQQQWLTHFEPVIKK